MLVHQGRGTGYSVLTPGGAHYHSLARGYKHAAPPGLEGGPLHSLGPAYRIGGPSFSRASLWRRHRNYTILVILWPPISLISRGFRQIIWFTGYESMRLAPAR